MTNLYKIKDDQEQNIQKMLDETKTDKIVTDFSVEDGETREIKI
nr:hypothetical protein [Candidatus Prometheoarchaeum syntrophicum]